MSRTQTLINLAEIFSVFKIVSQFSYKSFFLLRYTTFRGCGFMTLPDKFMPPKLHMQPPSWVVKPTGKAESPKGRHSLNGNNKVAQAFNTLSVAFALSGRIYHATRAPDYFDKLSK